MNVHFDPEVYWLLEQNHSYAGELLHCLLLTPPHALGRQRTAPQTTDGTDFTLAPTFCLDPDTGALRTLSSGPSRIDTVFNQVHEFGGQYVAQHVQHARQGKLSLDLRIVALEMLPDTTPVPTAAPGSQGPLQGPIELPNGWMAVAKGQADFQETFGNAVRVLPPNSTTKVTLNIAIDSAGHVTNVDLVDGPKDFGGVLVKATRKVTYIPFQVAGAPTSVKLTTTYTINTQTTVGGIFVIP